ncbi:MAG: glutamate-5-semialdehyde dehydrogenase, partial [Bacteroidetes bacterium]
MNKNLTSNQKNAVLKSMTRLLSQERETILVANRIDVKTFAEDDKAMYDRLIVNGSKIDGMIESLEQLVSQEDPVGKDIFHFIHENGLKVTNKTAAFGTVMIIYESRPDVTVEAGGIAFKSGNKILLKGGKEAINSNLAIVDLWHKALEENDISKNWVEYMNFNRQETQEFLKNPTQKTDLIVPRGGEKLIAFVKDNATCPVIVSGRGNNFVYVHTEADLDKAIGIIVNAKTAKISACNALDKVLIDSNLEDFDTFMHKLLAKLKAHKVEILGDEIVAKFKGVKTIPSEDTWYEEFLDHKILIAMVSSKEVAIAKINKYSGGHSASIITENKKVANEFLESVDSAAVYHNASTRFTDGFQFGLGGELAISTDKL